MEGGINTSAYVRNPNAWIDPTGLTGYSGNETTWTVGPVIHGNYKLTSQCVNKYRVHLDIDAVATGIGGKSALAGGVTSGKIAFFDNNSTIYPSNLNGAWGGAAIEGSAIGKGISFGGKSLGISTTKIQPDNGYATTNVAIGTFLGKVVSFKEKWSYCGEDEKPICGPGGCFDKKRTLPAPGFSPSPLYWPTTKEPTQSALEQQAPLNFRINFNGL